MIIIDAAASKDWKEGWETSDFNRASKRARAMKGKIKDYTMDDGNYLIVFKGLSNNELDSILDKYIFSILNADKMIKAKDKKSLMILLNKLQAEDEANYK